MRVAFAMESLRFSGGHQTVAEHARRLAVQHGFEVALVDCFESGVASWDFDLPDAVRLLPMSALRGESFDVAVATWWSTAAEVSKIPAQRHAYFVQSLEDRWFADDQPESTLARMTLDLGMPVITEATWIADLLGHHRPHAPCHLVRNGVDKEVFPLGTERPLRGHGPLRVLVEAGTGHSPTKGVAEALAALGLTREPLRTTIVGDASGSSVPAGSSVVPVVPQREISELYATHDVLLKTSRVEGMYGPPLEAFHRGATVVTTPVTGHDEFIVHGHNALVSDWDDPVGTARAIDLLGKDRDLLEALRLKALETAAAWPSWDDSADAMAGALEAVAAGEPDDLEATLPVYLAADRFSFESAARTHSAKIALEAANEHIQKLEYAWHLSEESRGRLMAEAAESRESVAEMHSLREEAEIARLAAQALRRDNDSLRATLAMRPEARAARALRRIRDYFDRG